jgi:molybdenum cofactor cytidylyltransferase
MDSEQTPTAGIVLAAGTSSRMGRNKLLIEIEGEPMLRRVVRRSIQAKLDPVLVVIGHEHEQAAAALDGLSYQPILNPSFEQGMTTSLQAGIRALPASIEAALMILGDMPYVTAEMLADLVTVFRSSSLDLVQSRFNDVSAPPTLFGRNLFNELLELPVDRCPRSISRSYEGASAVLDWPVERLKDFDGPEDVAEAQGS